jgi:hypothetical protein
LIDIPYFRHFVLIDKTLFTHFEKRLRFERVLVLQLLAPAGHASRHKRTKYFNISRMAGACFMKKITAGAQSTLLLTHSRSTTSSIFHFIQ